MWSLERSRFSIAQLAIATLVAVALSGCLRPMYGPTATGESLSRVLAAVEVAPVGTAPMHERIGHYVRNELAFNLDGSGQPSPKRYKLTINLRDSLQTPIVDTATGRAVSATINVNADYTLATYDGAQTLAKGTATASASYERSPQRFADVRAARDAEIRAAKVIADQIRTRLAAALVSPS